MTRGNCSRRKYLVAVGAVSLAGVAGCSSNSDGDSEETDEVTTNSDRDFEDTDEVTTNSDRDFEETDETTTKPTSESTSIATTSPEEALREMLQALAASDRETVRQLTAEEYSGETAEEANLTIESTEQYSAEGYAEREGTSVSAVEEDLADAENLGYADATIVSYTVSTEKYGRNQAEAMLVLDGDQWLVLERL